MAIPGLLDGHPDLVQGRLPEATEDAIRKIVVGMCAPVGLNPQGYAQFDDTKVRAYARWNPTRVDGPNGERTDGVSVQVSIRLDPSVSLFGGVTVAIPSFKAGVAEAFGIDEDLVAVWIKDCHVVAECEVATDGWA